jgi:hypothetical protein
VLPAYEPACTAFYRRPRSEDDAQALHFADDKTESLVRNPCELFTLARTGLIKDSMSYGQAKSPIPSGGAGTVPSFHCTAVMAEKVFPPPDILVFPGATRVLEGSRTHDYVEAESGKVSAPAGTATSNISRSSRLADFELVGLVGRHDAMLRHEDHAARPAP